MVLTFSFCLSGANLITSSYFFIGLEHTLFQKVFSDFRKYCATVVPLPADLHIKLSDVIQGHGTVVDIFPFFLEHAKTVSKLY